MVKRDLMRYIVISLILMVGLFVIGKNYLVPLKVTRANANHFLKAGDVLIYTKQKKPMPNDFIVYTIDGKRHISRVIAQGDDKVMSMDDVLYINEVVKAEPYIEDLKAAYHTQTNHQSNFTMDFNLGLASQPSKTKKRDHHYFVLNDNRQNLQDSRTFGLIKQGDIKGVLTFKLLPFESFGFLETQ